MPIQSQPTIIQPLNSPKHLGLRFLRTLSIGVVLGYTIFNSAVPATAESIPSREDSLRELSKESSASSLPTLEHSSYQADLLRLPERLSEIAQRPSEDEELEEILEKLEQIQNATDSEEVEFGGLNLGSPGLSIANPIGFGADGGPNADKATLFISGSFQERTRYDNVSDGGIGFGVGFGDAVDAVGAEISYTMASLGGSRDFGDGGINVKIHHRFTNDLSVAVGANGIITTDDSVDFDESYYGAATMLIRTRPSLCKPFSRMAFSAGMGTGQFRMEDDIVDEKDTVGVFGSLAVRAACPVSMIVEWTGQDLATGVSISPPLPIRDLNLAITPAVRDIVGAGDGPRFILTGGLSWQIP